MSPDSEVFSLIPRWSYVAELFLAPRYIQNDKQRIRFLGSDITFPARRARYDITSNGLIIIWNAIKQEE